MQIGPHSPAEGKVQSLGVACIYFFYIIAQVQRCPRVDWCRRRRGCCAQMRSARSATRATCSESNHLYIWSMPICCVRILNRIFAFHSLRGESCLTTTRHGHTAKTIRRIDFVRPRREISYSCHQYYHRATVIIRSKI